MAQAVLIAVCLVLSLSGCSKLIPKLDQVVPDNRIEYRKSKTLPDLEVPPGLTTDAIKDRMAIPEGGQTATYSSYQERVAERKRHQDVEKSANDAVRVLDNEHVLAVQGAAKQIWPKLVALMGELNYTLELNDEDLGILETTWIENQEELARTKFKIFAEPGQEAGTTVLYISNRSEELVTKGSDQIWQPKARDVEHERVLVDRVQERLVGRPAGTQTAAASVARDAAPTAGEKAPAESSFAASETTPTDAGTEETAPDNGKAEIISTGGGKVYLSVLEDFSAAWRSTGVALKRAGIDIDQADKDRGIYFIRVPASEGEIKKRGVLSKLKFWGDNEDYELQLNLTGVGAKTEVVVLDKEGRWETGDISKHVLDRLHSALNRGDG
ncbi:MAG: outer membrane protein assembly factor BamC [Gammaproteobacteria bacterium]|nr:outer membrane protein assembly factor BamC [Gammaproteobacteria bacterium]